MKREERVKLFAIAFCRATNNNPTEVDHHAQGERPVLRWEKFANVSERIIAELDSLGMVVVPRANYDPDRQR